MKCILNFIFALGASVGVAEMGSKSTIYTSGEKVYPVHYQLGQSITFYFGFKPETVICGNTNYFNIEKIKDGLTIQPLSNFSTNLTVINRGMRYLFYLMPSAHGKIDSFLELKWIEPSDMRALADGQIGTKAAAKVVTINQTVKISSDVELGVLNEKSFPNSKTIIFELEAKNTGKTGVSLSSVEVLAFSQKSLPIPHQTTAWQRDSMKPGEKASGRVIVVSNSKTQPPRWLEAKYFGRVIKIQLKGLSL